MLAYALYTDNGAAASSSSTGSDRLHGNSRSTVGVMLDGNVVENMVVGGQYAD
jgi:hypothetical protein